MNPRIICGLLLPTCALVFTGCHGTTTADYETGLRQQIGDASTVTVTVTGVPTAPGAPGAVPPPVAPPAPGSPPAAPTPVPVAPGVHVLKFADMDRQIWAANLHVGPEISANPTQFDKVVTFTAPKAIITWKINAVIPSTDPAATPAPPAGIVGIKGTGDDTSEHIYMLTPESNTFAEGWFKKYPPA